MKTIDKKYAAFNRATKELHDAIVERIGNRVIRVGANLNIDMFAYVFDYISDDYVKEPIYALTTFENNLAVNFGYYEDNETDEQLLDDGDWYTIYGGELSIAETLISIAENLRNA